MFWRALFAFVACPGMVAIAVPAIWLVGSGQTGVAQPIGLVVMVAGLALLLWCVRDFYVAGKGTLAPWQPPARLVEVGLYRHSRNPMYLAVSLMLLGWAWSFGSVGLLAYAFGVMLAFQLRVVVGEEPWLARTFGAQWEQYRRRVPRWLW